MGKIYKMKAHVASAVNAFTLLIMGGWGYFSTNAPTALIPVFFGVILLVTNNGIRNEHKVMSHIAVFLTLLITIALFKPFSSAMADGDALGMVRTGLMALTSMIALFAFIKSFRAARKRREANS